METTTTTLTASPNPSSAGQTVTLTATVTNNNTNFMPTGTITITDLTTGQTLDSILIIGHAGSIVRTIMVSTLTVGTHSLRASFSGGNYVDVGAIFVTVAGSDSAPVTQTVNALSSSTALVSSLNPSNTGQSVTLTATVTGGGALPTGTVTFKDGTTVLGSPALSGGSATFTTSSLGAGTHAITAVYSGDATYDVSTSSVVNQVVNLNASSLALNSSVNPSNVGQAVTFTATVTGGGATPTGTVTFKDGATVMGSSALSGGSATFTTSALTTGTHAITAVYNGDATHDIATSAPVAQSVNAGATSVALTSSANPSNAGQSVTFTAGVTGTGGTPTGAVTFRDGATVLGSASLAGGVATFTTSSLGVGTHPITASYGGDANFAGSNSAVLNQAVQVPADSGKLRAMQIAATKLVAQSAGQAIDGAVSGAIADGFAEGGQPVTMGPNGLRFSFAAETRVEEAFSELAYSGVARKVPPLPVAPREWMAWLEIRGTGWDVDTARNATRTDIAGTQVNALAGLTRKMATELLVGAFGGYETFDYSSQVLAGRLKGDGWTVGGYFGWRPTPGLRFDATLARSGVNYEGTAGTAAASFPGTRWLASAGLTGTHKTNGFEFEPSARLYALWEREGAYIDNLGTPQTERTFTTGRGSGGVKVTYPLAWMSGVVVAPYAGIYGDYHFSHDDAVVPTVPQPIAVLHGWSARVIGGLGATARNGAKISLGGEVGGFGSDFTIWSARARAHLPF